MVQGVMEAERKADDGQRVPDRDVLPAGVEMRLVERLEHRIRG